MESPPSPSSGTASAFHRKGASGDWLDISGLGRPCSCDFGRATVALQLAERDVPAGSNRFSIVFVDCSSRRCVKCIKPDDLLQRKQRVNSGRISEGDFAARELAFWRVLKGVFVRFRLSVCMSNSKHVIRLFDVTRYDAATHCQQMYNGNRSQGARIHLARNQGSASHRDRGSHESQRLAALGALASSVKCRSACEMGSCPTALWL